jgi:hypothetical protein
VELVDQLVNGDDFILSGEALRVDFHIAGESIQGMSGMQLSIRVFRFGSIDTPSHLPTTGGATNQG